MRQLHKGGVRIRRLGGASTNVEGGCVYDLEVPSIDRDWGRKDKAV